MGKVKILYVEDEPFLGRIVRESLESREFDVVMIAHGSEALDACERSNPDLCVLDVMLPGMDGYTIARKIRERNATLPIIFVTAKTQTEDVLEGFAAGGHDYVRKPFSIEELIVRINSLLRLKQGNHRDSQEEVKLGKYTFVPGKFELQLGGKTRKLSGREASLLQLLAGHRDSVISRKDILMKVWGDDSFFNSRNLDVYITRVRDLLKEDPQVEILTIKGVGYRFVCP